MANMMTTAAGLVQSGAEAFGGMGGGKEKVLANTVAGSGKKVSLVWEPVLILSPPTVIIESIELKINQGQDQQTGTKFAWLYNTMIGLFRMQIKQYILENLEQTITENATELLTTINGFVRDSWPVIATATNAELDSLPLVDHQVTQAQRAELSRRTAGGRRLDIVLEHPGPLGLHLDINEKRGFIRFSAPVKGGQAESIVAAATAKYLGQDQTLKGAYLVAINRTVVSGMSVPQALELLKTPDRPKVLSFVLPAHTLGSGNAASSDSAARMAPIVVQFSEPSLGMRLKASTTITDLVTVTGFARGPEGQVLPAEATKKIEPGFLLVDINGNRTWGSDIKEVASNLKAAASVTTPVSPMSLTFMRTPDTLVSFQQTPFDLMIALIGQAPESFIVVTGFSPTQGPIQATKKVSIGDTLISINGTATPCLSHEEATAAAAAAEEAAAKAMAESGDGAGGQAAAVMANGKLPSKVGGVGQAEYDQAMTMLKTAAYPLTLGFEGLTNKGKVSYTVTLQHKSRLGITMDRAENGRPTVVRFNPLPGPAASTGLVRPGMVLLKVNDTPIDASSGTNGTLDRVIGLIRDAQFPGAQLAFRDMDQFMNLRKKFAISGTAAGAAGGAAR